MCHLKTYFKHAYHIWGQQVLPISLIIKESAFMAKVNYYVQKEEQIKPLELVKGLC